MNAAPLKFLPMDFDQLFVEVVGIGKIKVESRE